MEVKLDEHREFSAERIVTETLHSSLDMRVLLINLSPGQGLQPHKSSSSVNLHVVSGECELFSEGNWLQAPAGTIRFYAPSEFHGLRATDGQASVLATLAPRP